MNRKEILKSIDMYSKWINKNPNEIWSKQHADFINSGLIIANSGIVHRKGI